MRYANQRSSVSRILAALLALGLALPSPAAALRQKAPKEAAPSVLSGLEERLRSPSPDSAAGLEELERDAGAARMAPVFQDPPDFSGLADLRAIVGRMPEQVRPPLLEALGRMEQAPSPDERWRAVDEWVRLLNEQLVPAGKMVLLRTEYLPERGIEVKAEPRTLLGAEWWEVDSVRLPVGYVRRLAGPLRGTTGVTFPGGVYMGVEVHGASFRRLEGLREEALRTLRAGGQVEADDLLPVKIGQQLPRPVQMARFLLEETRREELRHLQMTRRVTPALVGCAVSGARLSAQEAAALMGLKPGSYGEEVMRAVAARLPDGLLGAREMQVLFLQGTERAAILERLGAPAPAALWGMHEMLEGAGRASQAGTGLDLDQDPSGIRTHSLHDVVQMIYWAFDRAGQGIPEDRVSPVLAGMDPGEWERVSREIWEGEYVPGEVPWRNTARRVDPEKDAQARSLLDRMARKVLSASGLEEGQELPGDLRREMDGLLIPEMREDSLQVLMDRMMELAARELADGDPRWGRVSETLGRLLAMESFREEEDFDDEEESSRGTRERAAFHLGVAGHAAGLAPLRLLLGDPDPATADPSEEVRRAALEAVTHLRLEKSGELGIAVRLVGSAAHSDHALEVRRYARTLAPAFARRCSLIRKLWGWGWADRRRNALQQLEDLRDEESAAHRETGAWPPVRLEVSLFAHILRVALRREQDVDQSIRLLKATTGLFPKLMLNQPLERRFMEEWLAGLREKFPGEPRFLTSLDNAAQLLGAATGAGLEEGTAVLDTVAQLADAAQGPGVLVVGDLVLRERPGLKEMIRRSPELRERVVLFDGDRAGLVAELLSMDARADSVSVLGDPELSDYLERVLPESMEVTPLLMDTPFKFILAALGVPEEVLDQVDTEELEGRLAGLRSA